MANEQGMLDIAVKIVKAVWADMADTSKQKEVDDTDNSIQEIV